MSQVRTARWMILTAISCSSLASAALAAPVAFPGAEGFGAKTTGGRGGAIYWVTNLNDKGPGSLRDACLKSGGTILFKTSGTITLKTGLNIKGSNLTIAGESAPGEGICIRGEATTIVGSNIIVRFLRCRPGDDIATDHDALTIGGGSNVIVDHCSMSWSVDSLNDVVHQSRDVTVQWCLLAEPLNKSRHTKGAHGFATGWGSGPEGHGASYHHNLIAHANSRAPRIGGDLDALVDVRNNVIYDTGTGEAYGGEDARINYVANYFKPGPSSKYPDRIYRFSSTRTQLYIEGNVVEGLSRVTDDNKKGLLIDDRMTKAGANLAKLLVGRPFAVPSIAQQPAAKAYELVLPNAGAVCPKRDAVDARVIQSVRDGTGRIIDSPDDVGGWPELKTAEAPLDSDGDGLPDAWEQTRGLNPRDPADGSSLTPSGYTQLELYLHSLAAKAIGNL